jgi:hypothetical protein
MLCWLLTEQCCEVVNLVSSKIGKKTCISVAADPAEAYNHMLLYTSIICQPEKECFSTGHDLRTDHQPLSYGSLVSADVPPAPFSIFVTSPFGV